MSIRAWGYTQRLTNSATGQVYWTANARDAELHLLQDTAGNGVVNNRTFSAPGDWAASQRA